MDAVTTVERITPFESASELREAHSHLLDLMDVKLGRDASAQAEAAALADLAPKIREFIERGATTGAYLEDITERTACQTLLDYWVSSLAEACIHIGAVRLARFERDQLPDLKDKPCPYAGLEAFRDPTFFFGREPDIQAVVDQLREVPLVVVAGTSGSGKSSLVIGGVLPALASQAAGTRLVIVPPFVPGNAALEHLAEAVLPTRGKGMANIAAEAAAMRRDPQHLCAMVGGDEALPTLITVDQFEEVFTLLESDPAEREALVANLAQLLDAGRGHRIILTVREEFRSNMVGLLPLSGYLENAWYSMRPMLYDALWAAIEKPAQRVNLQFQPGIVDDLAKKVLGQPAALPLLQFALKSLWKARDRNRITWEVYHRIGDPLSALKIAAEKFYTELMPETQEEVKRILLELVRVDELLEAYRQPVAESRLLKAGKANTKRVLEILALPENDYIRITPGKNGADAVVEVKHEAVVRNWPRLVGWIDEKRVQMRQRLTVTQAAQRWAQSGKPEDGLLTGWQLQTAEAAAEAQPDLSPLEKEFIDASREAIERKAAARRRKARRFYWGVTAAALTVAAGAIGALVVVLQQNKRIAAQSDQITRQAETIVQQTAEQMRLSEEAHRMQVQQAADRLRSREDVLGALSLQPLNYMNDQRDLALLLSLEALRKAPDQPELLRSLFSLLTTNLELQAIYPGHAKPVRAVRFSPNRKVIASASEGPSGAGVILLRDAASGRLLFPPLREHQGTIYDLAFSADGNTLASAGEDKTVRLWNVNTGKLREPPLIHGDQVIGVAIAKDGTLASAGADGLVTLWNLKNRRKKVLAHSPAAAGKPPSHVNKVAFSPNGGLLASGGEDGRIVLWDMRRREQTGNALIVNHKVFSLAFSPDGKTIASGSRDGDVNLWDVAARSKKSLTGHLRGVFGIAFSPDGGQLVTVSTDRSVMVHNLKRPEAEPQRLKGYAKEFYSVDFAEKGRVLTGTGNGMVVLWDLQRHHPLGQSLTRAEIRSTGAVFTVDGTRIVSHWENQLQFWPTGSLESSPKSVTAPGQAEIKLLIPAPNGEDLVTVRWDNSIELWNLTKRRVMKTLVHAGKDAVLAAAFSHDGRTLAVSVYNGRDEGEIWLFDMPSRSRTQVFGPWPQNRLQALAFSPTENRLAIGGADFVWVWDLDTSKLQSFNHTEIFSIAFSPNGRLLASGGRDSVVWLWDLEGHSGTPLEGHRGPVMSVSFSPDGKRLASGSLDKTVILWDVETRQPLTMPILAHQETVGSVGFSPDGRWMLSSGEDGSVALWTLGVRNVSLRACEIAGRNLTEPEWQQFFGEQPLHLACPKATANDADALALTGDRAGAERLFAEALRAALQADEPETMNSVCWLGSADGFAEMTKSACERAVSQAPKVKESLYRDSRGLARALTGDIEGAVADFTATVEYIKQQPDLGGYDEAFLRRRQDWVATLKEGRNPFNEALLKELRTE